MRVEVSEALEGERPSFWRLMQLYPAETSAFDGRDLNDQGLYTYPYFDSYWTGDNRHPFLVRVDGKLVGFALVNSWSYSGRPVDHSMAEFFVLRKYRCRGVGRRALQELVRRMPGVWELAEYAGNTGAIAFWREVIGQVSQGRYQELSPSERWPYGPIQRFVA